MATDLLTDAHCRAAKAREKAYRLRDGGGLALWVRPNGSRLWQCRYRFAGRQNVLSFGAYPEVTLEEARDRRDEARRQLRDGKDPSHVRKQEKARAQTDSFEAIAREWFEVKKSGWKTSFSGRMWARIEADILPDLGHVPIRSIEPPMLLDALRRVERRGAIVLARKVKQSCGQIFRYAIATSRADRDPSADLKDAMAPRPKVKHRAALKASQLPTFLVRLEAYEGEEIVKIALQLAVLTFVRTQEFRFAEWSEFEGLDGREPLWRIPPERMKREREHLVPLSRQAVALLERLREMTGKGRHLFRSYGTSGVISENACLYALYNMGYHSKATVHGFRGTASTVLNESGKFESDWIELQLAHDFEGTVRGAYNSAKYLKHRRPMMQFWADYLGRQHAIGKKRAKETGALIG